MENVLINARIASLSCTPEAARAALAAVGLSDYEDVPAGQLSQDSADALRWRVFGFQNLCRFGFWMSPLLRSTSKGVARLADLVSKHVAEGGVVMLVTHQEVPVDPKHLFVIEPERWAPKRRSAVERAMADAAAAEAKALPGLKRGDAKMFNLFMTILKRDLTLSLRRKSDLAQVIFFCGGCNARAFGRRCGNQYPAQHRPGRGLGCGASRGTPFAPAHVCDRP